MHRIRLTRLVTATYLGILLLVSSLAFAEQSDHWVPTALDDGRYRVSMPGRAVSAYALNNANKVYATDDASVLVGLSIVYYSQKGANDAADDPHDFLRRHCEGFLGSWKGKEGKFSKLDDPDYPVVEHRFRYDGVLPPAGYMTHRAFLVHSQVCSLFVSVQKNNYEKDQASANAFAEQYFDTLIVDRERERPRPFASADKDPSKWPSPTSAVRKRFDNAHGLLSDRFAICQTMDFDEFHWVANQLRPAGYRPVTLRPYVAGHELKVAAIWMRNAFAWYISSGQRIDKVGDMREQFGEVLGPGDIAGYTESGQERFCTIWPLLNYERGPHQWQVGVPIDRIEERQQEQVESRLVPVRRQRFLTRGLLTGEPMQLQNSILSKPRPDAVFRHFAGDRSEYDEALKGNLVPFEISLGPGEDRQLQYLASLSNAKKQFKESHGLKPAEHLRICQEFAAAGFLPAALSVTHLDGTGYVTASIWHDQITEP